MISKKAIGIFVLVINASLADEARVSQRKRNFKKYERKLQQTVPEGGICSSLIPPSPLPPDDSTCWQWWNPPDDGVLTSDMTDPPKGCDYEPCENAVCQCDDYCCNVAWDLSCRGYFATSGDESENNYFVPGCSAKLLCCEPESAYPDPPIGGVMPQKSIPFSSLEPDTTNECIPGSPNCCETMIPPSFLPPDNSSCWQWWEPPAEGVLTEKMTPPPKGCDYQPCQNAVCACDSYCCDTAWDLSCRGYKGAQGDGSENNYFVDSCSAKILCCEPESAFPDPPVGGAIIISSTETSLASEIETLTSTTLCEPGTPNCCDTMIPPSILPPNDSTCWQWWDPPVDGVLTENMPPPRRGCNYKPCENAVCACDPYCCDTAWDLSCRGYEGAQGDFTENNYFADNCSAKILCCEPENAVPDPPLGGSIIAPTRTTEISNLCEPGTPLCCETMIPPSYFPPRDSSCWDFWIPPIEGVVTSNMPDPPKGCDYTPCENAVCACDPYCCEIAWDTSCRGYEGAQGDSTLNNFFVDGCSARILCCELQLPGGLIPFPNIEMLPTPIEIQQGESITVEQPVAIPVPIPVPVPVPGEQEGE